MTLLAVQQVLSRVLTDPGFREAFFREPASVSVEYPLSERELASLAGLDQRRVETCAAMLLRDRVRFALYAFPASAHVLGPLMPELAPRFARRFPPVPTEDARLEREGPRMLTFVRELLAAGELGPAYLGEVMDFEHAVYHLSNSEAAWRSAEEVAALARRHPSWSSEEDVLASVPRTGEHTTVRVFSHDVVELADRLAAGDVPASAPRRPTVLLLTRRVESPRVHRQRVNRLTAELLSLCDGTRTAGAITDELAVRAGARAAPARAALARRTVAALVRLREAGVVGLSAGPTDPSSDGENGDRDRGPARRPRSGAFLAGIPERSPA